MKIIVHQASGNSRECENNRLSSVRNSRSRIYDDRSSRYDNGMIIISLFVRIFFFIN